MVKMAKRIVKTAFLRWMGIWTRLMPEINYYMKQKLVAKEKQHWQQGLYICRYGYYMHGYGDADI